MADRMTIILQLGALQEAAALRGEDRAVAVLRDAVELLIEDKSTAEALASRRSSEAERQRRKREKPGTSRDVTSRTVTALEVSPDPFLNPKANTTPGARDAAPESLVLTMGDCWPSVDRFVSRRDFATWAGWFRQMGKEVGPGSQYLPADLARVCDDDEALKSPIGSPFGLRVFLQKARLERVGQSSGVAPTVTRGGQGRAAIVLGKIRELVQVNRQPGQGSFRYIRQKDLEALGPDVVKAYNAIGGSKRVLGTETPKDESFLIREFAAALEEAANAA